MAAGGGGVHVPMVQCLLRVAREPGNTGSNPARDLKWENSHSM